MKIKKQNRLRCLILSAFMLSAFAFGCDFSESGDTTLVQSKAVGYLEDFGNDVKYEDLLLPKKSDTALGYNSPNVLQTLGTQTTENKIVLSKMVLDDGEYSVNVNGTDVGKSTVTSGELIIKSLPDGLVLGNEYTIVCKAKNGKPYEQKVKYVSKVINEKREFFYAMNYYKTYKTNKNESPTPADSEKNKFYDGESFSQRLYVLDTDLSFTMDDVYHGIEGTNERRNPACWLKDQENSYFYDIFDGQGYMLTFSNLNSYGVFGRLCQNAVVKNVGIKALDNYWGATDGGLEKSFIGCGISTSATVQNCAFMFTFPEKNIKGLNLLAPYVGENAKLKDIYIYLQDTTTCNLSEPTSIDGETLYAFGATMGSGYLGYDFGPTEVDRIYVVANGLKAASRRFIADGSFQTIEGTKYWKKDHWSYLYAENQSEVGDEPNDVVEYLTGCYYYSTPSEMFGECNVVGNWQISSTGNALYLK